MSYKTLLQITDEVANTFQDTSTTRKSRIKEAIQRGYDDYAKALPWPQLIRFEEDEVTLAAGDKHFYTPETAGQLLGVFPSGQHEPLDPIKVATYLKRHGYLDDIGTNGVMASYVHVGTYGHAVDITSTQTLVLTPSVADRTALNTIAGTVQGRYNGEVQIEEFTCTNGFPVTTTRTWDELYAITIDGNHTDVFFASNSVTNDLYAQIPPGTRTNRYHKYRLGAAPSEAKTLSLVFKRRVQPLFKDHQSLEIPIADALYHKALAELYRSMRKPGPIAQTEEMLAEQIVQRAFEEATIQGDHAAQAIPMDRYRQMPGMRR